MTVVLLGSSKRFIGAAADAKPTGVPAGSTFYAQDTGMSYVTYDSGANWVSTSDDAVGIAGVVQGALTNRSGTITAGGSAQQAAAANAARRYLLIQNKTTASESFWMSLDTTAVSDSPSVEVAPGVTLTWEGSFIPSGAVSVIAASTGTAFTAKEG